MNNIISEVEEKTAEVKRKLTSIYSSKSKTILLFEYYKFLLDLDNKQITESYIPEFAQDYIERLKNFDPFCINPSVTQSLIEQAEVIKNLIPDSELTRSLINANEKLKKELLKLNKILSGEIPKYSSLNKLCFPLLEENNDKTPEVTTGILETLTIKISKAKSENIFLVIPSEIKIETELKKQIKTSWWQAIKVVKKYARRIAEHHEVIIHFDKRVGFYRGNSLGAALTLAFIEELLNYYNSPVVIKTGKGIALTGGLEKDGRLIATSKEIIEKKVKNVFYSPVQTFVVPEEDLPFAEAKLKSLQKEFPGRKLNLIGIKTLEDLLDSRKLVDIRKQKIVVRSTKFAKKNWVSLVSLVLFSLILTYLILVDLDTNPSYFTFNNEVVEIRNNSGNVLWTKRIGNKWVRQPYRVHLIKIIDIDNNGRNEVLISAEFVEKNDPAQTYGRVVCLNSDEDVIWEYIFKDSVSADINHSNLYFSKIIDVINYRGNNIIYLFAQNKPLYPSVIYKLDAATGKRVSGTFWHAGLIAAPFIGDFNEDGEEEIVAMAINNGFEQTVIFSINLNNLEGQGPSTRQYKFNNIKDASFNKYILLPKSELTNINSFRYNYPNSQDSRYNSSIKEFQFSVREGRMGEKLLYSFTNQLQLNLIDFSDLFLFKRDSLVNNKILSPPLTNTNEYRNLLKEQIRYWDGERLVREKELK